tara:strand:- start:2944 stop:3117 length:174 start_codon:yes stop_codon:yes gene_type:complete
MIDGVEKQQIYLNNPILKASINCEDDIYDEYGRNYSAYIRRQKLVKWTKVAYSRKRY